MTVLGTAVIFLPAILGEAGKLISLKHGRLMESMMGEGDITCQHKLVQSTLQSECKPRTQTIEGEEKLNQPSLVEMSTPQELVDKPTIIREEQLARQTYRSPFLRQMIWQPRDEQLQLKTRQLECTGCHSKQQTNLLRQADFTYSSIRHNILFSPSEILTF